MSVRTYEQISDLPQGITPVSGTELVELEQDGVSRKFTMTELGGITAEHQGTHQFGSTDPVGTHDKVANAIPYLNASGVIDDHVSDASTTVKGKVQLATDGGTTAGTAVQANDGRLSNARAPTGHASAHYGVGGDLIPDATTEASGLMSNGDKTKLDNQLPSADEKAALAGVGGTPSGSNKYVTDADGRLPTAEQKAALAGSYGTPSAVNRYVTETDPILGGSAADITGIENWASFFRMFGAPEKIYDWSEVGSGVLVCGAFYNGTLFCGTTGGIIYRQNADGTFSIYQVLPSANIMFTDGTNFYIAELSGDIYKMDGSGVFQATGQTERNWTGLAMHEGYLYATVFAGDIYKMDGAGVMQATGQTSRQWTGLASDGTNLYASARSVPGDIYKMDGSGVFQATGQTARGWGRLCIYKSVLYATIESGGVYWMNSTGIMIDTGCSASDGIDTIFRDMFTDDTYFYSVDAMSSDIYSFANKTPSINIPAVGTLPIPSTFPIGGRKLIRRTSAYDGNPVTITPPSGATFEGMTSISLYGQYSYVILERISATLFAIVDLSDDYLPVETITPKKWIDGKRIYRKVINFGTLPNSTIKSVLHNIASLDTFTCFKGSVVKASDKTTLAFPYINIGTLTYGIAWVVDSATIQCTTGIDRTSYSAQVVLEYTKT